MTNNDLIRSERTFCVSGDCAVTVVGGLRCPRCGTELTADDCGVGLFGDTALQCSRCKCVILAVSLRSK